MEEGEEVLISFSLHKQNQSEKESYYRTQPFVSNRKLSPTPPEPTPLLLFQKSFILSKDTRSSRLPALFTHDVFVSMYETFDMYLTLVVL